MMEVVGLIEKYHQPSSLIQHPSYKTATSPPTSPV